MSAIREIIFRGDQACYLKVNGGFPYVDRAKAAGATGVLIWFWGAALRAVAREFCAYCRDRGMGVHVGIGLGAYDVCDGEDPLDAATMGRIRTHIDRTLEEFELAGVEYQTGEYDLVEFKGAGGKTHAERICQTINPYVDYILRAKGTLWVRTELSAEFCPAGQWGDIARGLDARCTVEWSRFTGPFAGEDCFDRGRALLRQAEHFSWFLKVHFRRDYYTREILRQNTPEFQRAWVEHFRGWVKLLDEHGRRTVTICNVDDRYPYEDMPAAAAAAALARDPGLPTEEVIGRFFAGSERVTWF